MRLMTLIITASLMTPISSWAQEPAPKEKRKPASSSKVVHAYLTKIDRIFKSIARVGGSDPIVGCYHLGRLEGLLDQLSVDLIRNQRQLSTGKVGAAELRKELIEIQRKLIDMLDGRFKNLPSTRDCTGDPLPVRPPLEV
ncbi:MAG: hypothetical protein AB7F86_15760 [Bdellovibrionales bacterium]